MGWMRRIIGYKMETASIVEGEPRPEIGTGRDEAIKVLQESGNAPFFVAVMTNREEGEFRSDIYAGGEGETGEILIFLKGVSDEAFATARELARR